jgi:hypothetical protein
MACGDDIVCGVRGYLRERPMSDELEAIEIRFEEVGDEEANQYAQELSDFIRAKAPGVEVDRKRTVEAAQDLGGTLGVILASTAVVAVAQGIKAWLEHRTRSKIVIKRSDGTEVTVDNLSVASATELAPLLIKKA